jgi:hypothetical protein
MENSTVIVNREDLERLLGEHWMDCDHGGRDCPVSRLQDALDRAEAGDT